MNKLKDESEIIHFWFTELDETSWYKKDPKLDLLIQDKFLDTHRTIVKGECASWRSSPVGRLGEIIVLDQFSRNMFRDQAEAFAYDPLALFLAQECIRQGDDQNLSRSGVAPSG